ncbi:T9SS type A sorting domain-containing protein [Chryseosolibacter indicus]|uniref:T9SS type A sorting domain-containing protein n=1 Tax=Chryseosolibacter indicus TaxID=2782351 RepID=A0ABS5VZP1_9BACT|nr:T9SS type A sorting domain-containing protein [Chryseosolibacter indicus]MBT1706394.1 T9SS type A sorting domain-containing protein [Chryseosolibacter indicus]
MVKNVGFSFLFFCLLMASHSFAQKEATNWYFGLHCGLRFDSREPDPVNNGSTMADGGTAVMSDRITGELLFYTDGRNFWNRKHEMMQNDHTLPSNCFSRMTQPAIIIPSMSNPNQYHVFCIRPYPEDAPPSNVYNCLNAPVMKNLADDDSGLALLYYLIDMTLDVGMGNVVNDQSNKLVQYNVTEKLTAVPHANGTGHWIITHGWRNNSFFAHHLSQANIVETVTTTIGSVHGGYGAIYFRDEVRGELKASPNGRKIAAAIFSEERPFDLFDFDASNGTLSNYINLGNIAGQFGISFSPDNSKLYVTSDSRATDTRFLDIILQYDLSSGDPGIIAASGKSIVVNNPKTNLPPSGIMDGWSYAEKGMALAPDGRLYISSNDPSVDSGEDDILVVINRPNEPGFDADIRSKKFAFGNGKTAIGLPNFMQSYFNGIQSSAVCNQASALVVFPNPTSGSITINVQDDCDASYSIDVINAIGQQVYAFTGNITSGDSLDLSFLPGGIYFLIVGKPGFKTVKKVIKL